MAKVQPVREFVASVVSALHNLEVRYSEPRVTPLPYFETMAIFDQVLAAHDAEVAAKALYEAARDARAEKADGLLRGVVEVTWLRARAAAIRAEVQR